jgi:hypothetical protein
VGQGFESSLRTKKVSKIIHIRASSVLARWFAVVTFVLAQCAGRDCEIRVPLLDLPLSKRGPRFGVEIKRIDAPSLTGSMRIALVNLLTGFSCGDVFQKSLRESPTFVACRLIRFDIGILTEQVRRVVLSFQCL